MSAPAKNAAQGTRKVPASVRKPSRSEVEDLLYLEAELLDAWDLDTWLTLYTEDSTYILPATDTPDGNPDTDLVLIDDDRLRMTARVERLNSRKAHREYPHSSCRHMVTNVRVGEPGEGCAADEVPVRASFLVRRSRGGKDVMFIGGYTYRLVEQKDEHADRHADQPGEHADRALRIRHKRVELDMSSLRPNNDVAIIL